MPDNHEPNRSDLMDLLFEAYENYRSGGVSDIEYIARINICMSAEHQRRERAADPEGYDSAMLDRAIELGLVDSAGR